MFTPGHNSNAGLEADSKDRYIVFQLGNEQYAVPILRVQEVRASARTTYVPRAPSYLLGVTSVRGAIIPVIDLRIRFELPPAPPELRPVLIGVQINSLDRQRVMAISVDSLVSVNCFNAEQIKAAPELGHGIGIQFAMGIVDLDQVLITILDIDRLLNSGELALLEKVGS